ncbi:MAG: extracellular solute-binding protein [Dehalococcoidia bacterium]|nr:extracellular solute-binding protein [Dehalococcoidia bacterium]
MRSFVYWLGSIVLVFSLFFSACAPKAAPAATGPTAPSPAPSPQPAPAAPASEWDKIVAAATKEGTVTLYNVLGASWAPALQEAMNKYKIKVEIISGNGAALELKVETEQRAKAMFADIFISGWTNNLNLLKKEYTETVNDALLPELKSKAVWRLNPNKYDPTKNVWVFGTSITPSLIINSDIVKKGEIRTWNDLLDPKWRDKIAMTEARQGSGPGTSGMFIFSSLGEEFWKKMAAQRIPMHVSYDLPVSQVALGEKYMALFPAFSRTVAAIKAGAPVQIAHLEGGTSYYINGVNLVKNAPHPNAALVVFNWMFSKEGQVEIGKATDNYTVRNDVQENWIRIPELNLATFTLLEPANNSDLAGPKKGTDFATLVFGAR